MTASLSTPKVLVARSAERAGGLVDRLRSAGIDAVAAPVIERAPVDDPAGVAALSAARAALSREEYAWVAVTSVNAVEALLGPPERMPNRPEGAAPVPPADAVADSRVTRWACVGPATRRAIEARGLPVALVPDSRMTAAGLVEIFPTVPPTAEAVPPTAAALPWPTGRRVLVPVGDLAAPTLADGLRAKGWEPDVVVAYRTVARELAPDVVVQAKSGGYDAVVVASGSAAREVAAQVGPQRVVAIGEPSAEAAREAGHEVVAVAARPTNESLAAAVVRSLDLAA